MLLRFKRLIFSNEIKTDEEKGTNIKLNGNDIKKISSGGDTLTGRIHGGLETEFIPHFLAIIFSNDLPQIIPYDAAVDNRVKVIGFNKTFVDDPENEYELKKDINIDEEITTDKFKQHFIMLIISRYIQFLNNNKIEVIPEEVNNSKKEWIGDESEINIISKFLNEYELTDDNNDFTVSDDIKIWLDKQKSGLSIKKLSNDLKKYCIVKKLNIIVSKPKKIRGKLFQVWLGVKTIEEEETSVLD
jgi:phage/plasmid-associated DNA primase